MAYVLAIVTQVNLGNKELLLKARGKAISRAVDAAEIVKNKFIKNINVANIDICTEEITSSEGQPLKVSAIEIKLTI